MTQHSTQHTHTHITHIHTYRDKHKRGMASFRLHTYTQKHTHKNVKTESDANIFALDGINFMIL